MTTTTRPSKVSSSYKTAAGAAAASSSSNQESSAVPFAMSAFPMRKFANTSKPNYEDGWITAYKVEKEKHFQAVLTNKKLDEIEQERASKEKMTTTKRKILKNVNFSQEEPRQGVLDGFFLIQLCCVEDPLDIASVDISDKNLSQIIADDMILFDNITTINASENSLNLESFKCFANLKSLSLNCNNIKTIRVKHGEFEHLENLDLSFNNLAPNDVAHLGILKNLRVLKLTGNNLTYLPDTFSKQFVYTQDNKKVVCDRFSSLEELHLDKNKLKEEDSFDVLSVLKKLKRLYLNENLISCIPKLKIYKKVHVVQEFSKSYYLRKSKNPEKISTSAKLGRRETKINESIVKDLDRPSSEMNIHHSNTLRNSFILEEEEEEDENEEKFDETKASTMEETTAAAAVNDFEKKFELPFPELLYINLADNQLSEDDDLIGLAAWPSLNEIILYGNPIIYNNVGFTPLIKKYLIDRLGINIKRLRPLRPLKTQFLMPLREERLVDSKVPKVQKFPIEMRLLGYDQQQMKAILPDRSNFSSAKSSINEQKANSIDSHDTVGHMNNNQQDGKKSTTFFMTQTDNDELEQTVLTTEKDIAESPRRVEKLPATKIADKYEVYKELLAIENEEAINVPTDLVGSLRELKHTLDNPVIIRPPYQVLNSLSKSVRTTKPTQTRPAEAVPKLVKINQILDNLRERKTRTEIQLTSDNPLYNKYYKEIQNKYQKAKNEFYSSYSSQS